jgi:hypothetical protein
MTLVASIRSGPAGARTVSEFFVLSLVSKIDRDQGHPRFVITMPESLGHGTRPILSSGRHKQLLRKTKAGAAEETRRARLED